ncbi:MAG: acyl--CoA ligase, partial [Lachnospiraceae bacterium]|nr:acyl--CoA ligase [Lachnospiraceae bacterium]
RTSAEGIREYIIEADIETIVVIDIAYNKILKAIEGTKVKNILVVSPSDSLPKMSKILYKMTKRIPKVSTSHYVWKSFIENGKDQKLIESEYHENECCVIVHTGGTTGMPKGVMLSNENLNQSAFQLINSAFQISRGDVWADIMPPFIAYGIGNGLHMPLIKGMEVVLVPAFNPKKYDELMIKYHPTHIVGVPSHYENIITSRKMKHRDISYLVSPVVGGDTMKTELEKKVDSFIKEHKGQNNVMKGYGMTEVSAAVSACMSDKINKLGSVGIPFAHTIISVFNPETGEEMGYGQKGEVCMTGPNTMIGYYKNEKETNSILRKHKDGRIWVHSGDTGHIDEDGFLFIEDRIKRIIVRHDGFKVFPSFIENVVMKEDKIKECCAVGFPDKKHAQGMLPVVFAVFSEKGMADLDKAINELHKICKEELPEYAQPELIKVVEKLPLTPIGKIDYKTLEVWAKEF